MFFSAWLRSFFLPVFVAIFLLSHVCAAQTAPPYSLAGGLTTGHIAHIVVLGSANVPKTQILAALSEKTGALYDPAAAAKDQARLMAMGVFHTVQVTPATDKAGAVTVTITVAEYPLVSGIKFTADTPDGVLPVPADALMAHMQTKIGQVLNTTTLTIDMQTLFDSSTGYVRAQGFIVGISAHINISASDGILTIPLVVARIARIDILGGRSAAGEVQAGLRAKVDDVLNINALQQNLIQMQGNGTVLKDTDVSFVPLAAGQVFVVVHVVEKSSGPLPSPSVADWLPVPIRWQGAIIFVQVNNVAASFLVDTTASLSSISPELAARLKLTTHPWVVNGQAVTLGGVSPQIVTVAQMRLGSGSGVLAVNEQMLISNTAALSKSLGRQIDGVLGGSDLGAQAVSLDWDARQMRFWERGNLTAIERAAAGFGDAVAVPLSPAGVTDLQYQIDTRLRGSGGEQPATLTLAVSYDGNRLPASDAKALGAVSYSDTTMTPPVPCVRPALLTSGGLSVRNLAFTLTGDDLPPVLGQNFLSRYRVLLDYPAKMVYLQPNVRVTGAEEDSVVPFSYNPVTTPVPVVEASLDGGPVMRFLFDTGFNGALTLDMQTAQRLKLPLNTDRHEIFNASLPVASAPVHRLVLQGQTPAGNLTVDLALASVIDMSLVRETNINPPIAGIIGAGILRDCAVRFDYQSKTLTFFTKPLPDVVPKGATSLPLTERTQDDAYFINQSDTPDMEAPLLIDSGSGGTDITFEALPTLRPKSYGINGLFMLSSFSLASNIDLLHFNLGDISLADTDVNVSPTEISANAWNPGTLGENILSRTHWTLDPPHSRLLLEPTATPAFDSGWVGLFLTKKGEGIGIRKVQPGSPAARAGIKAGDRLLSVDAYPLRGVSPLLVQSLANGASGTTGTFQIQHGSAAPRTVHLLRQSETHLDPPALLGIIGRRDGTQPFVVKAVLPGSAAESAGIHVGDSITTINGRATATMTDAQWQDIIPEPRLALTVQSAASPAVRTMMLQGFAPPVAKKSLPPKH